MFLLTDQVGSLRAVADTSGAIVKRIDYDSFGNIISDSNTAMTVPFGFAGGLHDRDTGLVRFGYRDYSPELGRFTAKDPIDFAGGDTNLYAYVASDPIGSIDPTGLDRYECCKDLEPFQKWMCKAMVSWNCKGANREVCCQADNIDCRQKVNENSPNYEAHLALCESQLVKCRLGLK